MSTSYTFEEAGRLPLPGDNAAIATRRLDAGTEIVYEGRTLVLDYTVLEGHRFAVKDIAAGEPLLSWELPFGTALRDIRPGQYVINEEVLKELSVRGLDFALPPEPNFDDRVPPFRLDENDFRPAAAPPRYTDTRTFLGYRRDGGRGVGTRNKIVLLGTTSRTGSFVKRLADRLQGALDGYPNVDGIVPVAHTEGDTPDPNNRELLLRTLAGFIVNPNVGAVLIVDYGVEPITNKMVEAYMRAHGYPLEHVLHRFMTLRSGFDDNLAAGEAIVRDWLPQVNAVQRTPESVAHLRIGLQCGGSDAFSGVSANPLLGWVSEELVRYGGAANLAETDELIGAEPHVLKHVRDLDTARKFMGLLERYRTVASWHGTSAEGNPSGGNKYRGLYNIYLKSIGAAQKKDPRTRLDHVIEYGEPMKQEGYYFMDSPGNDLESIAGQVAAGCNLIMFATGNGSITNFPFVPTIKVVTTTRRFELLKNDMDVNAGRYQDGVPMEELGRETFDLVVSVASGQRSVGEKAGHSQVQIWRNWRQKDDSRLAELATAARELSGEPIAVRKPAAGADPAPAFAYKRRRGHIGLIVPTSLCSGQIAHMITRRMNARRLGEARGVTQFVTLAHTEGCGNSGGQAEKLYVRTMLGYVRHPMVGPCLLLEHGCEKTHNDYMRSKMAEAGVDPAALGYASIQLDGGIEQVTEKVERWFAQRLECPDAAASVDVGSLASLRIGIMCDGAVSAGEVRQLARLARWIAAAGGTVVVPENSGLPSSAEFAGGVAPADSSEMRPTLGYGQFAERGGFHVMETPTEHWLETLTGLAATGVELVVAMAGRAPLQTHPFVPVLQLANRAAAEAAGYAGDMDLLLEDSAPDWAEPLLARIGETLDGRHTPRLQRKGNADVQFTRGWFGFSL